MVLAQGEIIPIEGTYVGKFSPIGTGDADGYETTAKCKQCHATGVVRAEKSAYTLALTISQGKGKKRITLKGKGDGNKVTFQNKTYSLTVAGGKLTGDRKGKLIAKIAMQKAPQPQTDPPAK